MTKPKRRKPGPAPGHGGRPKGSYGPPTAVLYARLPVEIVAAVRAMAAAEGVRVGVIVERVLRAAMLG